MQKYFLQKNRLLGMLTVPFIQIYAGPPHLTNTQFMYTLSRNVFANCCRAVGIVCHAGTLFAIAFPTGKLFGLQTEMELPHSLGTTCMWTLHNDRAQEITIAKVPNIKKGNVIKINTRISKSSELHK